MEIKEYLSTLIKNPPTNFFNNIENAFFLYKIEKFEESLIESHEAITKLNNKCIKKNLEFILFFPFCLSALEIYPNFKEVNERILSWPNNNCLDADDILSAKVENYYSDLLMDTIDYCLRREEFDSAAAYSLPLLALNPKENESIQIAGLLHFLAKDYDTAEHFVNSSPSYNYFYRTYLNDNDTLIDNIHLLENGVKDASSQEEKSNLERIYELIISKL
jgi:hypothetical protein